MANPTKAGTGRKRGPVAPQLPGASAPPHDEVATPQLADAPRTPLAEVLGEQQGAPPPARWWRWVALVSWLRRWLPAGLGLVRRAASWVAARVLLGHWARRAPPSRALVGDALAATVVATCSSARLHALKTILTASLAGVEPAASATSCLTSLLQASRHGDALAAAVASPSSSSPPPLLEVTSDVADSDATSARTTSVVLPTDAHAWTDTTVFATPPQFLLKRARANPADIAASQVHEAAEEPDSEREIHEQFWSEVGKCKDDNIVCLMCHLSNVREKNKRKLREIAKDKIEEHCTTQHGGKGTKCGQKGCQVRARNQGDIGAHQRYCHRTRKQ